ncbi:MAG TPA: sulfotransferase [Euzebyales bacterium]|nr:sulfotransferase [Euzebyales bacterium]
MTDTVRVPDTTGDASQRQRGDRPIFIVGCPRSGTTLVQLMLHAHPDIAIPPENRFLLEVYDRREAFGDLQEGTNRRKLAKFIVKRRRSRLNDLGLPPRRTRRRIVEAPPTIGAAVATVLRDYAAQFGKRRWGDKRPSYIHRLDDIRRMFPDAQIIHVIRDGRDCVASLKQMPWWQGGAIAATWSWRTAMIRGRRADAQLDADSYLEVRYEDLVAAPAWQAERMCAYLDERFDEAMLAPHRVADVAVPERKVWHARTHGEIDGAAVARWRRDLEPWELDLFEFVAARQLRQHGYVLSRGRRPLPPLWPLLRFAKLTLRRALHRRRDLRRDARRRRHHDMPLASTTPDREDDR